MIKNQTIVIATLETLVEQSRPDQKMIESLGNVTKTPSRFFSLRCDAWGARSEVQVFSFSHFYQQPNCVRLLSLGEYHDTNATGWCIGCGAYGVWAFLRPGGCRHLDRKRSIGSSL
jgi:hypothetical protein